MGSKDEIMYLKQENARLKTDLFKQLEYAETITEKLETREEEIKRLTSLLEGGRPLEALNADCCFKEISVKLAQYNDENGKLKCCRDDLELQLAEAIRKQHEAMKRALMLAARNEDLERELHDIDQMALAVEAECNCKIKVHSEMVTKMQDQLDKAYTKIEMLERELDAFRRSANVDPEEFAKAREEKENLHRILETALEDKRLMTDRMNQFQKIEHDLNYEIDKLAKTCTCQKRKIADLESQLPSDKSKSGINKCSVKSTSFYNYMDKRGGDSYPIEQSKGSSPEKQSRGISPKQTSRGTSPGKQSRGNSPPKHSRETSPKVSPRDKSSTKHPVESGGKHKNEMDKNFIEKLKKERNDFQSKCKTLQEQLAKLSSHKKMPQTVSPTKSLQGGDTLKRNLKQKDDKISKLEKNIQNLTREKHELITKLDEMKKWGNDNTIKSTHSKAEKERDMARGDCKRIEEERDALRQRLKQVTETHKVEMDSFKQLISESEKKFQVVESERRELVTVQECRRVAINSLEEQIESLSSQLRTTKSELEHIKTLHAQLKVLHEQTDRALAEAQGQITQVEGDYAKACRKMGDMDKKYADLEFDCSQTKAALDALKIRLTTIDAERDNLLIEIDNKTERNAHLEMELSTRNSKMMNLEKMVINLQQKLSSYTDELSTKEYLIKSNSAEINTVRRGLDEALKDKSSAIMENKRLQEDVCRATNECGCLSAELVQAKREIEDLKTQLQQYVFEIKRAEDLISKKELERAEMLDQFHNLSEETSLLETNNHTLESKASEVRNQLSTATNHIHDLESNIEQLSTLNADYEKQINQMTQQIAALETQVRQSGTINKNVESEMCDMKCLCVKLDEQKEALKKEIKVREEYAHQLEIEKEQLKSETNKLKDVLNKESSNIGALENLLAACRQETVEQRLLNQELQSEIHRLKNMVQDLQNKLRQLQITKTSAKNSFDYEQQSPESRPKIPEKTIFDEVSVRKTLYCSGTQQNFQSQPEQRNVGIQQIFHSKPEYVEADHQQDIVRLSSFHSRNNSLRAGDNVDVNRFYSPHTSNKSKSPNTSNKSKSPNTSKSPSPSGGHSKKNTAKSIIVCTDDPTLFGELLETKKPHEVVTRCPYSKTEPILEEGGFVEYNRNQMKAAGTGNIQRQTSGMDSIIASSSGTGATFLKNSKLREAKPTQKLQPYRNSTFWRNEELEETEQSPNHTLYARQNCLHSEPAIRMEPGSTQRFRSYQSESPIQATNALDHSTFHSIIPPIEVRPYVEKTATPEEEALRVRQKTAQDLTIQKMCLLKNSLNLNDSRTRLIYHTEISDSSSPFQSKSSSWRREGLSASVSSRQQCHSANTNTNTNTANTSDSIVVTPEACKQTIVDSAKAVTFACMTSCQTVDDIDAKCKRLLQSNSDRNRTTNNNLNSNTDNDIDNEFM